MHKNPKWNSWLLTQERQKGSFVDVVQEWSCLVKAHWNQGDTNEIQNNTLNLLRLEDLCSSLWGIRLVGTRLITIEKVKSLNMSGVTRRWQLENGLIEVNLIPTTPGGV